MEKIKVVNIISDTNIGGAGKCILTYGRNYDKNKFDLTVVVPRGSLLKQECGKIGINCIEADCIADESMSIGGIFAQRRLFKQLGCDIVHTHAALSARIAARLAGVKGIVYTRHCVYEPSKFMKSLLGKIINKIISSLFCDKIIAVAQAAADNLTDVGISEKKIDVILNGIKPLEPLSEEEKLCQRKRFGVQEGEKVVSLVARLEYVKGHDDFIKAAEILQNKGYKFIAAGNGSREQELSGNKYVTFTGFISDAYNLIGITDLSVNASFGTEATSISLLEGMSLGIPAAVTRYGGNPGVIAEGENGLLSPVHDPEALAANIDKILSDENFYEKLSKGAKRIFDKKFTAEAMSAQIESVYESLMGRKRKNG